MVQLSTPYIDLKCHNTQRYRQTDRQTTVSCQYPIIPHAAVQSAKTEWLISIKRISEKSYKVISYKVVHYYF